MVKIKLKILYEDNHLLGVCKESGVLIQGDRTGDPTLLFQAKEYIKQKYTKPGKVYLGLVHRLDRPVSGVVVFARTSKAASRLTGAFREHGIEKTYLAVVEGVPEAMEGEIRSVLRRDRRDKRSRTVGTAARSSVGSVSVLKYRVIACLDKVSLLEVHPETGRHHQIRVQLSSLGHPVLGDRKYNSKTVLPDRSIALHAWKLTLRHPVKNERIKLTADPPKRIPWLAFEQFF
jgi:23S rRNA pseudouridine1911/1915/1917 synthase